MAIGTHDLKTVKGPFRYDALPPSAINFIPLSPSDQVCPALAAMILLVCSSFVSIRAVMFSMRRKEEGVVRCFCRQPVIDGPATLHGPCRCCGVDGDDP